VSSPCVAAENTVPYMMVFPFYMYFQQGKLPKSAITQCW